MKKQLKAVVSVVASLSLVTGLLVLPTSAYASSSISNSVDESTAWEVPTYYIDNTVEVDGTLYKVITTWANAWALSGPDYIGVSNSGVINQSGGSAGTTDLTAAQTTTMLGIWASAVNEVPNAYNWNYFYNLALDYAGLDTDDEQVEAVNVQNGADAGYDTQSGVYACFKYRPEIIWTSNSLSSTQAATYAAEIASLSYYVDGDVTQQDETSEYYIDGDENYADNLLIISAASSSILTFIDSIYGLAQGCETIEANTADYNSDGAVTADNVTWKTMNNLPRTTRYEASTENPVSATEAATDLEKVYKGAVYYTLAKIADGTVEQKTVAFVSGTIDTTGSTATLVTYDGCEGTRGNSSGKVGIAALTVEALTTDTANGSNYTATADEILEGADFVWAGDGNLTEEQLLSWLSDNATSTEAKAALDTIQVITDTPAFMNGHNFTIEKGICGLYDVSFFYPELWPDLELVAYFYDNVYHIYTDDITLCMTYGLGNCTMPEGTDLADLGGESYTSDVIDNKFYEGYEYWASTMNSSDYEDGLYVYTGDNASSYVVDEASDYTSATYTSAGDYNSYAPTSYYTAWAESYEYVETISDEIDTSDVTFTDLTDDLSEKYYYTSVLEAAALGLMTGYDSGEFGVGDTMTRAQLAVIMWRLAEPEAAEAYDSSTAVSTTTTVSGIADGKYYTAAADWAVAEGVINGKEASDGSRYFDASGVVTFQQFCAVLANYADADGRDDLADDEVEYILSSFTDASSVASWAAASVAWCVDNEVVNGTDEGQIQPTTNVKRERAATVLVNAYKAGTLS